MKIYILYNKETDAQIKCTEKYLDQWISRGFDVESIDLDRILLEEKEE
ncbi:hypothetical protein [Paenibacillus odorifer]|nr:hypothetical protein [Paenibacillus odorifer]